MLIFNNNAVINNNVWKTSRPYFALQIPMSARENFFEIYRQFWHAPSKIFASPGLGHVRRIMCVPALVHLWIVCMYKEQWFAVSLPGGGGGNTVHWNLQRV